MPLTKTVTYWDGSKEVWTKSDYFCPKCGKQEMWNYSSATICSNCKSFYDYLEAMELNDNDEEVDGERKKQL